MKTCYLTIPIALFLLSGCTSTTPITPSLQAPLIGQWKLIDSSASARFENGRVSGSDGCNRYGAPYTSGENTLAISDKMMSTMMMCPPETMKNAQQFREALLRASRYRNDGKTLTLMEASGNPLLEFVPDTATP